MRRNTLVSAIVSLSLIVVACSDSVGDSAADLCSNLEDLNDTVQQVAGADVSADTVTMGQIQDAYSDLQSAVRSVRESEADVSDALKTQLSEDLETLGTAVQDIPADSTLSEAGEDVQAARTAFHESWEQTLSELNCSVDS